MAWKRAQCFAAACVLLISTAGSAAADDFKSCEVDSGDTAIAACDRAIASGLYSGVKLSEVYNNRGYELERKGQLDRAMADYNTSLSINANHSYAYLNRGNVRATRGDIDGAITDYSTAIRISPTFALAHVNRGRRYEQKGDRARAIADYRAALAMPHDHPSTAQAMNQARDRLKALGQ